MTKRIEAINLSKGIFHHYKRQLDVGKILAGKEANLPVSPGEMHSEVVTDFAMHKEVEEDLELVQALLDDLCLQGEIKDGDYTILP